MPPLAFNLLDPLALAVLLAAVGVLLLVAEVFFPSGGVLGLLSASALIAAVYYAFTSSGGFTAGVTMIVLEIIVAPIALVYALKILPQTAIGKTIMGEAPTSEDVTLEDDRHELVGRVGVARTKMLPSGDVEIDGQMLDAVTKGQAIEPGEYVKVVEVRGNRLMVRRAGEGDRPANPNPGDLLARSADELGLGDLGIGDLSVGDLGIGDRSADGQTRDGDRPS
ncbi:MAG: NfeD family protein [Planctomycetota bacterium]